MRVRTTRTGSESYWRGLRKLLAHPALPSQTDIAKEIGTDQGFVSHAIAGDLVRITERVVKLRRYASTRRKSVGRMATASMPPQKIVALPPAPGDDAIELCRLYVVEGYDAQVLADQVRILRRAQNAARF